MPINGCCKGIISDIPISYNPPPVTGALAWFDAQGFGTMKNNSGNNASNGETVLYWNDKSGNGYNLSQVTQSLQPTYVTSGISNKPSIYFNNKYINNTSLNPGTQYFTIFSVHTGSNGPIWDLAKSSAFEKFFPRYPDDGSMYLANSNNNWAPSTGLDITRPYICAVRYSNTPSLLLITYSTTGGKQTIFNEVTYTPNLTFNGGFNLGARNVAQYNNYLNGNIGEIILYNRSLTNTEIDDMITYFKDKWSI